MFIRSPYNYDMDAVSKETSIDFADESLAVQSAKEEADINTIVRRFGLTGELPNDVAMPQSGDFSNAVDFHASMNLVVQAQEEFLRLPADLRARFSNDPGNFIAFFDDPANQDEAIRLGLATRRPEPPIAQP